VDDLYVAATNGREYEKILQGFKKFFKVKDQKELSWSLGIEFKQSEDGTKMTLSQKRYIEQAMDKYKIEKVFVKQPMNDTWNLDEKSNPVRQEHYQSLIGTLMYLANATRSDLLYAVNKLAQYNQAPCEHHLAVARRVLQYAYSTREKVLIIDSKSDVTAFVDASFKLTSTGVKATLGYNIGTNTGRSPITAASRKIRRVIDSVAESELIALKECVKNLMWVNDLLTEVQLNNVKDIFCDNEAIVLLSNPTSTGAKRLKYVMKDVNWIKDNLERYKIKVHKVRSDENCADGLTKALGANKLRKYTQCV
jgi:hypothetical protein